MPFDTTSPITFAWEMEARQGKEFIHAIDAKPMRDNWTRALRAVEAGGVLVIQHYGKPVGILASPRILRDVLFQWRGLNAALHPAIEKRLSALSIQAKGTDQPFHPIRLGIRLRPKSVVTFLNRLAGEGGAAAVLNRRQPRAILLPLAVLARLKPDTGSASGWVDEVTNWVREIAESV